MKLRIRLGGSRCSVELQQGSDATLKDLQDKVSEKLALPKHSFDVSLNGRDAIDGDPDQVTLASSGIVGGDLVHIILKQSTEESHCHVEDKTLTAVCTADSKLLSQMVEMGFSKDDSTLALLSSGNQSIDKALEVLLRQQQTQERATDCSGSIATTSEQPSVDQGNTDMDQSGAEDITPRKHEKTTSTSIKPIRTLLCREGIPDVLQELYQAANVNTLHDAVLVVVHVLMLETGYLPLPNQQTSQSNADKQESSSSQTLLPMNWNKGTVQKFCYAHPACPRICFNITCTSLGPYVLVHGLADSIQSSRIFQSKLMAADFVRGTVDLTQQGASAVYRNLHRMSQIIKDQIAYRLLSFARSELGLPELYGFMGLPTEIKFMTLRCLPVETILHVSCTCHELLILTNDPSLWQYLCYRDFGGTTTRGQNITWKTEYKLRYAYKKSQERARQSAGMAALPHITDPTFRPFVPNYPPGIIGGRSDLFPDMPFMPGGFQPFPGNVHVPRPRFDPFGPSPDNDNLPRPGRGRGRGARGFDGFNPGFL